MRAAGRHLLLGALLGAVILVGACGGGSAPDTGDATRTEPPVVRATPDTRAVTIMVGQRVAITRPVRAGSSWEVTRRGRTDVARLMDERHDARSDRWDFIGVQPGRVTLVLTPRAPDGRRGTATSIAIAVVPQTAAALEAR